MKLTWMNWRRQSLGWLRKGSRELLVEEGSAKAKVKMFSWQKRTWVAQGGTLRGVLGAL